ncbi:hypothetical protein EBB07_29610 [Paenibacillaceae bacterium]|nr:hypothetical protein EBB07_29610 [Paenibacillaceae bacterium]
MPGVAINNSKIKEVIKPNHVTYTIKTWQNTGQCLQYDPFTGQCINWRYDFLFYSYGQTGAKITGYVSTPSSKATVQGVNVAKVDDTTIETWVAHPPVPTSNSQTQYTDITPGRSGSGQGRITSGSSKSTLNGKKVALIGSEVTTHLGVKTTIEDGNTKINMN